MKKVLVLCTGNSCRSQMAEAYLRYFAGPETEVYSAGVETHGLNPRAVAAMREDGIDLTAHTCNHLDEYADMAFDFVITVCDHAREQCPIFPGKAQKFHQHFPDPARAVGNEEEVAGHFREVRDLIKRFAQQFAEEHLR